MRYRISCGVIPVYVETNGTFRFLLVQGYGGYWGFPKGHKKKNESHQETALRELQEETGIIPNTLEDNLIFTERYRIPKKRGTDIMKKVVYYISKVPNTKVLLQTTELKQYAWCTLDEAREKLIENRIKILERITEKLT